MSKVNFNGLGVALITPFHEDGSIDYEALSRLLEYQLEMGQIILLPWVQRQKRLRFQKRESGRCAIYRGEDKWPDTCGNGRGRKQHGSIGG